MTDLGDAAHGRGESAEDRRSTTHHLRSSPSSPSSRESIGETFRGARDSVEDGVRDAVTVTVDAVKPRLRGWLHAATFPIAVVAGAVLVALSPGTQVKIATAIFAATAAMLFGGSALYHRFDWSPRVKAVLRRLDHANIFLIIAGTYTPFTILLLDDRNATILLSLVWGGALVGVAFRVLWLKAPRWLYVPVYIALGWAAAFWLPDFLRSGEGLVFALIVTGGVLYSLGAIVYATKKPNPSPRWFGFHEVFHSFTIAAFVTHYIGISLAVLG